MGIVDLVFIFTAIEWLLDYILKIGFRQKPIAHVPYILLEYVALFSLIGISKMMPASLHFPILK